LRTVLLCPFTAGNVLWQAQGGAWTLTVAVRGTFAMVHGREAVLAEGPEPVTVDRHYGDDPRQGLWAPSDLALYKPRTDVTLVGSAFAADQVPVEALIARLSLGDLDKSIGVVGDRVWIEGPDGAEPSAPRPFAAMPLRAERAARARDNPLGFDLTRAPAVGALALPNLEAADDEIGGARTVGFGPVPPFAGTRRALLPPDSWAWLEGGGRGPLPAGFDFAFYNAAPRDQQVDLVRGGAPLVLEHLNRDHARLETRLPTVRPKAFLVPAEEDRGTEIVLRCDSVWIDTDRALFTLTWRGIVAVPTPDEEALGTLVVAAESKGREVSYRQIAKLLRDGMTSTTTDGDTFSDPSPLGARHDAAVAPSAPSLHERHTPPTRGPAPIVPVATPAPVVIEGGRSNAPSTPLWEELSSSDLFESTSTDEPKTLQRMLDARRALEDPLGPEDAETAPTLTRAEAAFLEVADYARIAAAVERGEAARVLQGYGLTMPDLGRLTKIWTDRISGDPAFAERFARELAAARRAQ
jgi:hypothetical protein